MPAIANPSKRELTHERILDAASRAIRRAGHTGASVAEVMKEAGLTHGGFYAHFDSREKMVASAIAYAGAQSSQNLRQSMAVLERKGRSPFRALVESYLSSAHMAAVETGCVVAALGSEIPRQTDEVRQAASERVDALIRLVGSVLPENADPGLASHIASTMVGALQMARALGGAQGEALMAASRRVLTAQYG
jgi:TetR/AcrR family transcriptional regulator, transcriptional repressor for nem operon